MTSASTLSRQAAILQKKGLGKVAKRMREKAAKMRRDGRKGKKPRPASLTGGTQQHLDEIKRMDRAIATGKHSGIVAGLNPAYMQPDTDQPGRGEIVGGYLAHMAEELAKLARKKGGVDAIQGRLMTLEHQNRHDEKVYANQRVEKAVKDANEQWRTNIVAGFIARCDALESASRNGLPDAMIVDGVTMARVIDALKASGYTARGKEQKATEQRVWRAVER